MSDTIQEVIAETIARVAHRNGRRADGVTYYIEHPKMVAHSIRYWNLPELQNEQDRIHAVCAAWLHDVVEDTCVTYEDLFAWKISVPVIRIVELLTKPAEVTPRYYERIAEDPLARIVKAADRLSNLRDAEIEALADRGPLRWRRYGVDTRCNIMPLYEPGSFLYGELNTALVALDRAINSVL